MPENKGAQNEIEAELSQFRIIQLQLDPVQGNFNVAHLKEINRRIFQDFPAAGLVQTPGEFRPPVTSGDWIKARLLTSQPVQYTVAYSRMDAPAQARLHAALDGVLPSFLRLDQNAFTTKMAALYAELDYIHPFLEGNSRTLREFTRQLARAAGYNLKWDGFNNTAVTRDMLCIARDKAVNTLALPHLQSELTVRKVATSLHMLSPNEALSTLLKTAVLPYPKLT